TVGCPGSIGLPILSRAGAELVVQLSAARISHAAGGCRSPSGPGLLAGFAAAVGCAVVASFSFGAGIAVWLVGVIALMVLWRQNRYAYLAAWLACAALTLGLYFYHLDRGDGDPAYALAHPAHVVAYVLAYIGSWTRGAAYPAMILAAPGVDWLHVASGLKAPLMLPLVDALPGPVRSLLVGI